MPLKRPDEGVGGAKALQDLPVGEKGSRGLHDRLSGRLWGATRHNISNSMCGSKRIVAENRRLVGDVFAFPDVDVSGYVGIDQAEGQLCPDLVRRFRCTRRRISVIRIHAESL